MNFKTLAILVCGVVALAGCESSTFSKINGSNPISLSGAQTAQIKATVTRDFFDAESARFRNIRAVEVSLADGSTEARVCGEVNGKNRMGGYTGYSMFGGTLSSGVFQKKDYFAPCEQW